MMEMAAIVTEEMGSPIVLAARAVSRPWMMLNTLLQIAADYPFEERRAGASAAT